MKLKLIAAALLMVTSVYAQRPQRILGAGEGGANFRVPFHQLPGTVRNLSRDTVYILTGWYFVDSTARLNIQSGTLILGDSASGGTLIVRRGARLYADGTSAQPIVFTSRDPVGRRSPGDWGGLIMLGAAPTNKPTTQQIEGGFGTIPNSDAQYGGNNLNDTSGVLRYVRVEFGGIAFSQDNEINGITFGGVGAGTIIDYVQVSFANDDDFEFFGGTVNAKHLVSWRSLDDNLDSDFGWAGRVQYAYIKRDPAIFDASASGSSNGFESDNEATAPFSSTPRTRARLSNITLIGPMSDTTAGTVNSKWSNLAMIRRASELSIHNSVLMAYPIGINIRDSLTQRAAIDGRLQIRNTSIQSARAPITQSSSPTTPNLITDVAGWFNTPGWGNLGSSPRTPAAINLVNPFPLNPTNDPRPSPSSELVTAGTGYRVHSLDMTFFDSLSYRGAFDPSLARNAQWDAGWTNYSPETTVYLTSVKEVESGVPTSFALEQNYPNPFNPSTNIRFTVPQNAFVTLKVYNMIGQEVATLVNQQLNAGTFEADFNAANLSSGSYIYRIGANDFVQTRKMLLIK